MIAVSDLHTHTSASDGQYAPAELVKRAKAAGIQVLAVTDHDTTAGVEEAQAAGAALGLCVVQGVELSAKEHHNFHILGYGFSGGKSALTQLCDQLQAGRDERKYHILGFLHEKGLEIALEEVEELAGGQVIARQLL